MVKKWVIRSAGVVAMVVSVTLLNPIQAQENSPYGALSKVGYNAGLLASESGDYTTAAAEWQPLAAQGDALAQFNLALMYHRGLGVSLDEAKAVSWYHKSAENGYSKAQEFLVVAYREGWFGLRQDQQKSAYWGQRLENSSF